VVLALCILCTGHAFNQSLKKGFEALEIHDYFKAKKVFARKFKKNKALSAYGLARVFLQPNNPFQNIDSAHYYIQIALDSYELVKSKVKAKYEVFGFKTTVMEGLRQEVSTELFQRARVLDTEDTYVKFISQNFWANEIPFAVFLRDSCAFEYAVNEKKSESLVKYIEKYPTTSFLERAWDLYYKLQFKEETVGKREEDYLAFLSKYPSHPYVHSAEQLIFKFYEDKNTIQAYEKFISTYSKSSYLADAWIKLYRAFIKENGLTYLGIFKTTYPNYPFMEDLEQEIKLLNERLFPCINIENWGFMNHLGEMIIASKFDFVEPFSQGRSAVLLNNQYGFIDTKGSWLILPQFSEVLPFRYNLSVVYNSEGKAGLINLFGEWILSPQFDDILIINDEKIWIETEDGYVMYSIKKNDFEASNFQEISDFVDGFAIVSGKDRNSLIDLKGNIQFYSSEEITRFGELFLVQISDSSALVNEKNEIVLPFGDYEIGNFNKYSLTPFVQNEKLGYINNSGEIVINARLDIYPNWKLFGIFEFGHSKAYNSKTKKFGLIDEKGNWLVQAKYDDISFFSEMIAVRMKDKWEFILANGTKLNFGAFDFAESFLNDVALVKVSGAFGLINSKGELVLNTEMKRIIRMSDDVLIWENSEGELWLGDQSGKFLWPEPCSRIDKIDDEHIRLISNEKVHYYIIKERRFVSLVN